MKDYIEREALCELALNSIDKSVTPNDIMRFPKSDVKEVIHAHWENHTHCTACGWAMEDDVAGGYYMVAFPYCPNCGATMDRTSDDELNEEWVGKIYSIIMDDER